MKSCWLGAGYLQISPPHPQIGEEAAAATIVQVHKNVTDYKLRYILERSALGRASLVVRITSSFQPTDVIKDVKKELQRTEGRSVAQLGTLLFTVPEKFINRDVPAIRVEFTYEAEVRTISYQLVEVSRKGARIPSCCVPTIVFFAHVTFHEQDGSLRQT